MNKRSKCEYDATLLGLSLALCIALSNVATAEPWSLIQPLDGTPEYDKNLARIGWHLFRDPKLSSNGQVSCESCHDLQTYGAESKAVSTGVQGVGLRNSPTVFNAALNYRFLWDGSVNSLMSQLDGPVENPVEMDSNWQRIADYVSADPHYQTLYQDAGALPINTKNIKRALVEFVRALQTPRAPFDDYLLGLGSLNKAAERGWQEFQTLGCVQCHQGMNVGGSMIQQFTYFESKPGGDTGRHLITKEGEDLHYFRVPSLRNVSQTAPYFHNGEVNELAEAIKIMAKVQLSVTVTDSQISDIEAFLISLNSPRPQILEEFEHE